MNPKFYGMLGLAMRAGKVACGETAAADAVRSGTAKLLILAADASQNTEKKFQSMAEYYRITVIRPGSRDEIGSAIGKSIAVSAAVTDAGIADRLRQLYTITDER